MVDGDSDEDEEENVDVSQSSQAFTISPLKAGRSKHIQTVFNFRKIILFFFFYF